MTNARFPTTRMRRNRRTPWSRRLVAENTLSASDFIWPVFVAEGSKTRVAVPSMPDVERMSVDLTVKAAEEAFMSDTFDAHRYSFGKDATAWLDTAAKGASSA